MNKSYKTFAAELAILTLVVLLCGNTASTAQAQTLLDTSAATSIGTSIDASSGAKAQISAREKLRLEAENLKKNQEIRNNMVGSRAVPINTSGKAVLGPDGRPINANVGADGRVMLNARISDDSIDEQGKDLRRGPNASSTEKSREEMRGKLNLPPGRSNATSTMGRGDDRDNKGRNPLELFRQKKENITKQLQVALRNLVTIRGRIDSRIQKEKTNGRDMTKAIQLLATADLKITAATTAVNALKDYMPATSTTSVSVSSTAQVNLDTARQLANKAQTTIKEAQKALNNVIVAVAQSMGFKLGENKDDRRATTTLTASSTIN